LPTATISGAPTNSGWCTSSPAYYFNWTYNDNDSNNEIQFDFQVDDSGTGFPSPEVNRSVTGLSNPPPNYPNNAAVIVLPSAQADYLTYGRTYNWRVRVYDSTGLNSGWVLGPAFTTPVRRSPVCDFTWSPANPNVGENVNFMDISVCYDAAGSITPCVSWTWSFTNGAPSSSTTQNPTNIKFSSAGAKNVTLTVSDGVAQCSETKQVPVNLPLPNWKEIHPW